MPKILDLTGLKFTRLTVLRRLGPREQSGSYRTYWECACDCGNVTEAHSTALKVGSKRSCGCLLTEHISALSKRYPPKKTNKDVTGAVFTYLTAISPTSERHAKCVVWLCRCKCGKEVRTPLTYLTSGNVKSCGCIRKDNQVTHGASRAGQWTSEYGIWAGIIQRCNNPKAPAFDRYGGRGIKVCNRWFDFENFLSDMGPRPPSLTLERKDNDKGYEPSNCEWATRRAQNRNRRDNRLLTFGGRTLCAAEWSEEVGIPSRRIISRLWRGWSVERTLTTPVP